MNPVNGTVSGASYGATVYDGTVNPSQQQAQQRQTQAPQAPSATEAASAVNSQQTAPTNRNDEAETGGRDTDDRRGNQVNTYA